MLVSRDEQSCLVVSYKEVKSCIDSAFRFVLFSYPIDGIMLMVCLVTWRVHRLSGERNGQHKIAESEKHIENAEKIRLHVFLHR